MKKYNFKPCPLCGNCKSYRRSVKVDQQVVEPAGCAVGEKPQRIDACGGSESEWIWACDGFGSRHKKDKRMKRRMKKWERQFSY